MRSWGLKVTEKELKPGKQRHSQPRNDGQQRDQSVKKVKLRDNSPAEPAKCARARDAAD